MGICTFSHFLSPEDFETKVFGLFIGVQKLMPQFPHLRFALCLVRGPPSAKSGLPLQPWHPGHTPECPILFRADPLLGSQEDSWRSQGTSPKPIMLKKHELKLFFLSTRTSLLSVWLHFCLPGAPWGSPLFRQILPPSVPKSGHSTRRCPPTGPASHPGQESICHHPARLHLLLASCLPDT